MSIFFPGNRQFKTVSTFSALADTDFKGDNNAICWARSLNGDFSEIVFKLSLEEDITEVSIEDLLNLELSPEGDAWFPAFDEAQWRRVSSEPQAPEGAGPAYHFDVWDKV